MARGWYVNGAALVLVKFGAHVAPNMDPNLDPGSSLLGTTIYELGLPENEIPITPRFYHRPVYAEDFGPEVPAEVLSDLAEVNIRMTLLHFDPSVLDAVTCESLGGAYFDPSAGTYPVYPLSGNNYAGIFAGAGLPLGNGQTLYASGCHYVGLSIAAQSGYDPYTFWSAYLAEEPFEFPVGTKRTGVVLHWKAIPYQPPLFSGAITAGNNSGLLGEVLSSGITLWSRDSYIDPQV